MSTQSMKPAHAPTADCDHFARIFPPEITCTRAGFAHLLVSCPQAQHTLGSSHMPCKHKRTWVRTRPICWATQPHALVAELAIPACRQYSIQANTQEILQHTRAINNHSWTTRAIPNGRQRHQAVPPLQRRRRTPPAPLWIHVLTRQHPATPCSHPTDVVRLGFRIDKARGVFLTSLGSPATRHMSTTFFGCFPIGSPQRVRLTQHELSGSTGRTNRKQSHEHVM